MKKYYVLFVFAWLVSVTTAYSQFRVGAQLGYGFEVEEINFGANAEIFLMEKLSIAPSIVFYAPDEEEFDADNYAKATAWEINADVHYYFVTNDAVGFYGLAGLTVAFASVSGEILGESYDESDSEVGLNIGLGANFLNSGSVNPFAEFKYETTFEQMVISAGVRFKISE